MTELDDLRYRLRNVIIGTCNRKGCDNCDLKYDGGCSATDLQGRIMDIEMAKYAKSEQK